MSKCGRGLPVAEVAIMVGMGQMIFLWGFHVKFSTRGVLGVIPKKVVWCLMLKLSKKIHCIVVHL